MSFFLSITIASFGGGIVRSLMGFLKKESTYSYKNPSFNIPYFFLTVFISGIIGLLSAVAIKESAIVITGLTSISPAIAFIIGYAGGDFLEGIYQIILKKNQ